jgi:hypothetical protein
MSTNIPIINTGLLPAITKDYLEQKEFLKPFYKYVPNINSFGEAIKNKHFEQNKRTILVNALLEQNKQAGIELGENDLTTTNIKSLLNEQTFTVTTGHQLALFTGPLYFIYKITTIINLAKQLKEKYPQQNFVPVFWMASEDHDFEEISNIYLFGKEIKWHKDNDPETFEYAIIRGLWGLDIKEEDVGESSIYLGSEDNFEKIKFKNNQFIFFWGGDNHMVSNTLQTPRYVVLFDQSSAF